MGGHKIKGFATVNDTAWREYLELPDDIQRQFGASLNQIQHDERPFLPVAHLNGIGPGVCELKIQGSPAWRCVYIAKHEDTVFILHSFSKTTNGTDRRAMETCRSRYKELMQEIARSGRAR